MGVERRGEKDRRDEPGVTSSRENAGVDEFGRAAAKIAAAQLCESVGYEGFKESALDSLADMAIRYILYVGSTAVAHANLTGRTQCNVFDLAITFQDLDIGEEGLLQVDNCVVGSRKFSEIIHFVSSSEEEIPFAQPLPRFPIAVSIPSSRKVIPSFELMGETPPSKHIPVWLPAFPDPHTYKHTPMWMERKLDPREDKIEQARQRRKAERALLSLQQKLVSRRSSVSFTWGDMNGVKEELVMNESKPPVVPQLEIEEKDDVACRNNLSVVDAFAPAIEAAKSGCFVEGDGGKAEETRRAIRLRIKTGKKLLEEPLDLSLQKKGKGRQVPCVREEDRDDKRRRAEFILRQCMENPTDLNQL